MGIPLSSVHAWSDSFIVLAWLDGAPRRYKSYIGNRISTVTSAIPPEAWRHVPALQIPADCASRGLTPGELCQHSLWWNGPPWLHVEPIRVPKQPQSVELAALKEIELRPGACLITTAKTEVWLEAKYSFYRTLLHVTAWVQLFAQVFLAPVKHHTPVRKLQLSPADITAAELFLWKASQSRSYPSELSHLRSIPPQPILNSSTLLKLHPFWGHDGLLHIGGRLSQSPIADNQRFPVILSASQCQCSCIVGPLWPNLVTLSYREPDVCVWS